MGKPCLTLCPFIRVHAYHRLIDDAHDVRAPNHQGIQRLKTETQPLLVYAPPNAEAVLADVAVRCSHLRLHGVKVVAKPEKSGGVQEGHPTIDPILLQKARVHCLFHVLVSNSRASPLVLDPSTGLAALKLSRLGTVFPLLVTVIYSV